MPFKARLTQAIRDEDAKLLQNQAFLIVGPGIVVLIFMAIAGWLAVHVIRTPELFGGGLLEQIGYGILGVVILLWLTKGYAYDRWLAAWLKLGSDRRTNVAKIEAVMAKLERDEQEKAALAGTGNEQKPADDPWKRALSARTPQDNARV